MWVCFCALEQLPIMLIYLFFSLNFPYTMEFLFHFVQSDAFFIHRARAWINAQGQNQLFSTEMFLAALYFSMQQKYKIIVRCKIYLHAPISTKRSTSYNNNKIYSLNANKHIMRRYIFVISIYEYISVCSLR